MDEITQRKKNKKRKFDLIAFSLIIDIHQRMLSLLRVYNQRPNKNVCACDFHQRYTVESFCRARRELIYNIIVKHFCPLVFFRFMVAMVVTGERWVLFVVHSFLLTHFNRWCLFVMKLCNDLRILRMVFFRCYLQLIVFVTFAYVITKSVDTISVGGVFLCIFFLLVISYIFFVHNTWEIIHFLTVKKNCKNTYVFSF